MTPTLPYIGAPTGALRPTGYFRWGLVNLEFKKSDSRKKGGAALSDLTPKAPLNA